MSETAEQISADSKAVLVKDLTKKFGKEIAVSDLNFYIDPGTILALIGPSGCGKTTTVRLLTGIYDPTTGQAHVLGIPPQKFNPEHRQSIGYMTQLFTLFPDLTVMENMNFAASLYGMGIGRGKRIRELLEFVELYDDRHKLARNISGGMQRRLALAATLVHDPQIVFLDEPTAGIDPILRRKFWDQFQELKKQGKTLVITTQYVNEAAYCDYVGIMSDGKLIMVSTPEGLRKRAYGGDVLMLRTKTPLTGNQTRELDKLTEVVRPVNLLQDGSLRLIVDEASTATPVITDWLKEQGVEIESIEEYLPAYDDVFVKVIQDYDRETAAAAAVQTAEEVKS